MNLPLLTLPVFLDCGSTLKLWLFKRMSRNYLGTKGSVSGSARQGCFHTTVEGWAGQAQWYFISLTDLRKRHWGFQLSWHTQQTGCWKRLLQNWRQDGDRLVYKGCNPGWEVAQKSLLACGSYSQLDGMCLSVICKLFRLCIYTWNFHWFLLFQTTYAHTAMVSWNLSLESARSHWVGMLSFVDKLKTFGYNTRSWQPPSPHRIWLCAWRIAATFSLYLSWNFLEGLCDHGSGLALEASP